MQLLLSLVQLGIGIAIGFVLDEIIREMKASLEATQRDDSNDTIHP